MGLTKRTVISSFLYTYTHALLVIQTSHTVLEPKLSVSSTQCYIYSILSCSLCKFPLAEASHQRIMVVYVFENDCSMRRWCGLVEDTSWCGWHACTNPIHTCSVIGAAWALGLCTHWVYPNYFCPLVAASSNVSDIYVGKGFVHQNNQNTLFVWISNANLKSLLARI